MTYTNDMNAKKDNTMAMQGALAWVMPNPAWQNMVRGGRVLIQTYTLCNISDRPITIQAIGFKPAGDNRLSITGGTCVKGSTILPNDISTIHIEIDPRTVGKVEQSLQIQHSGSGLPLKTRIAFSVVVAVKPSYLVDETRSMDRQRRLAEQDGHRRLAKVHAREHSEAPQESPALEGESQNNILQNPWLDSQRFDGVDPNLNPEPPLNSEARREFDNERRDQEMEKQLRLGNMPKFSTAPKPQGGPG